MDNFVSTRRDWIKWTSAASSLLAFSTIPGCGEPETEDSAQPLDPPEMNSDYVAEGFPRVMTKNMLSVELRKILFQRGELQRNLKERSIDSIVYHTANGETGDYHDPNHVKNSLAHIQRESKAHFAIDQSGVIYEIVPIDRMSHSVGNGMWFGLHNLNPNSINIELLAHSDFNSITPEMYTSAKSLNTYLRDWLSVGGMDSPHILGHNMVAVSYAMDKSREELADLGIAGFAEQPYATKPLKSCLGRSFRFSAIGEENHFNKVDQDILAGRAALHSSAMDSAPGAPDWVKLDRASTAHMATQGQYQAQHIVNMGGGVTPDKYVDFSFVFNGFDNPSGDAIGNLNRLLATGAPISITLPALTKGSEDAFTLEVLSSLRNQDLDVPIERNLDILVEQPMDAPGESAENGRPKIGYRGLYHANVEKNPHAIRQRVVENMLGLYLQLKDSDMQELFVGLAAPSNTTFTQNEVGMALAAKGMADFSSQGVHYNKRVANKNYMQARLRNHFKKKNDDVQRRYRTDMGHYRSLVKQLDTGDMKFLRYPIYFDMSGEKVARQSMEAQHIRYATPDHFLGESRNDALAQTNRPQVVVGDINSPENVAYFISLMDPESGFTRNENKHFVLGNKRLSRISYVF